MGIVYLALDEKLQRKVAIKVLNSSQISNRENVIERFKSEAQNHAQLLHQNIVTVYGFIEFSNQFAIVMEYVEGESLDKVIERNKKIHLFDVVYIINQLLDGIDFAHKKGYIHRDIKPSNIIVNSDGIVKLMDFGISKSIEEEIPKTKTGARIGTIYYMSPEQIKGKEVTPRSDLYAIGCSIYEMITGLPPYFSQNEFDVMDGHLHKEFKAIDNLTPELSAELNRIITKLMEKNPDERYQSCADLSLDIHKLDQFIKMSENDYFVSKGKKKLLSKKKSVLGFSVLIVTAIVLTIFVFYQVKDFMEYKGYNLFEDGKDKTSFIDSSYSVITRLDLGANISLNSGLIDENFGGYIVGDSGIILNFAGSISNLEFLNKNTESNLNKVYKHSGGRLYIIGEKSILFKYEMGKSIIENRILQEDNAFFGIDFWNDEVGIIVGTDGLILRTNDSGNSWKRANSGTNEELFDVRFFDDRRILCVGTKGTILSSSNSGIKWERIDCPTDKYLRSIDTKNDKDGIIVGGAGTILNTQDSGESWEKPNSVTTNGLNKVEYLDDNLVLAVGNLGTVIISKDMGTSWNIIETNQYNNWNDIIIDKKNNKLLVVGSNGKLSEIVKGEN